MPVWIYVFVGKKSMPRLPELLDLAIEIGRAFDAEGSPEGSTEPRAV